MEPTPPQRQQPSGNWRNVALVAVVVAALLMFRLVGIETTTPLTVPPRTIPVDDTDSPQVVPTSLAVTKTPPSTPIQTPKSTRRPPRPSKNCAEDTVLRLFTPTYVAWIAGWWFVVDCWHHRVVLSESLDDDISTWRDLASVDPAGSHQDMIIPHSVATDGRGLVVVESSVGGSTGSDHSLLVYFVAQIGAVPKFVQEIILCKGNSARRPHRVDFDAEASSFFVYLTNPPSLAEVPVPPTSLSWWKQPPRLEAARCVPLPYMKGVYARSFAVVDSRMHITAGPGVITVVNHTVSAPTLLSAHPIKPLGLVKGRMNDLQRIGNWWYATSTVPCAFLRFRSLKTMRPVEQLAPKLGLCQPFDRSKKRCFGGTPYFVSRANASDDRVYVPYIFGCSGVVSFRIADEEGSEPRDVVQHWGKGWVEQKSDTACWGAK